jgi:hypothetical protein
MEKPATTRSDKSKIKLKKDLLIPKKTSSIKNPDKPDNANTIRMKYVSVLLGYIE